jgi:hypothetical protein
MEWAPGENGVVALAVVVVELAMVEVELGGAVVVVLAAMVLVEPVSEVVVELTSEVVVEMAIDVVVVVIIEVVVVVFFFCADAVPGSKSRVNDRNTSQVFFMVLAPLLIEIHSADARGNVARGISG